MSRVLKLAAFEKEQDAKEALGHVRRKFTKPGRSAAKWLLIMIGFAVFAEWTVHTSVFKGVQGASSNMASSPFGGGSRAGSGGALSS